MFYTYKDQYKNMACGGIAAIELKYCKLKSGTNYDKLTDLRGILDWQDDSLYVYIDDVDIFISNYEGIFPDFNVCGINYYSPEQLSKIISNLENQKPLDYVVVLEWLRQAADYNGIYILGV